MIEPHVRRGYRFAVLSVVKHDYLPKAFRAHPRCQPVVVADDADRPAWVHERNEQLAREFGVPYVRDVARALHEFDAEIAVVSSEAERHCDYSVRALDAGLHVVQDKPMSTELSECDRVVRAVQASGRKFMMWNRNRLPALLDAKRLVDSGRLGRLLAIHVDFYFSKDAGPRKGSRGPNDPPLDWLARQIEAHADGSDGGVGVKPMGELEVEGVYPLAYIHMLTGARALRVFARTTAHFHQAHYDHEVDDLATVTLELDGGLRASLCLGRIGAASHPDIGEIKLHVLGAKGGLVISEPRPEIAVYYRGQAATEFKHVRVDNNNDFLLVDEFLHAIQSDGPTPLDAPTSRDICATVQAAIRSGETGRYCDVGRTP
jgi:predicted dehydrogenase